MRRENRYIIALTLLLAVIFGLRIILGSTNTLWSTLTQWLIWIGSLSVLSLMIARYHPSIKTFFKQIKDLRILLIALLIMEILFMIKNAQTLGMTYPFGVILSLLIWLFITMILPKKIRRVWGVLTIILFGSYVIGQDIYLRIFNDYFSFKEALTLREGIESGESMYRFNWLHPMIILVMISSIWLYLKSRTYTRFTYTKAKTLQVTSLIVVILVMLNLNSRIPLMGQTKFVSDHYLYSTVYSRQDVAERFGFFHLMGRDLFDSLTPKLHTKKDIKAIDNYFIDNPKTSVSHEQSGLFEGMNLVFILAESYDEIALDPLLTPNLYRLKTEGMDFSNHYTPVYQRTTSDTEYIFNTGLIPSIEDGPTVTVYRKNSYRQSLAHLFKDKGYLTQAFHGNYKEFYARHTLYTNYGYDAFYGRDELGLNKENNRFDTHFFAAAKDLMLPTETPFMSFVITYSGHSPYTENHVVVNERIDQVEAIYPNDDQTMNNYRATQLELDLMLGLLFDALEEKNLLNNTVILLSGDHYPYTMYQEIYESYSGITETHLKQRGNLYIWQKDMTPLVIDSLSTSFDILPTVSSLFNLESNPTYYFGRDVFGPGQSIVLYKNYSYYNGASFVSLKDANTTSEEAKRIAEMYFISKKIQRTNYFKRGA